MPGIVSVRSTRDTMRVRYFPQEETLQTIERLTAPVKYIITSRNNLDSAEKPTPPPQPENMAPRRRPTWGSAFGTQVQTLARDAADGIRSMRGDNPQADTSPDAADDASTTDGNAKHSAIDPRIESFARQPDVSGSDNQGRWRRDARRITACTTSTRRSCATWSITSRRISSTRSI